LPENPDADARLFISLAVAAVGDGGDAGRGAVEREGAVEEGHGYLTSIVCGYSREQSRPGD
jgi:hypothetical protein